MGRKTQGPSRGPCQAGPPCPRGTPGPAAPQADCRCSWRLLSAPPLASVWEEDI